MTDDQVTFLGAIILRTVGGYEDDCCLTASRKLFFKNKEISDQERPVNKKATIHKPTVEEWNEAHGTRQFEKERGRT